jgi:hypothetical protein
MKRSSWKNWISLVFWLLMICAFSFFSSDEIAVLLERYEGGQLSIPSIGIVMLGQRLLIFTSLSFIVTFALSMLMIFKSAKLSIIPFLIPFALQLFHMFSNDEVEARMFLALSTSGWFGLATAQFASAIKQLTSKEL